MIENHDDEGLSNLAIAVMDSFRIDVRSALRLNEPLRSYTLKRLERETERGIMGSILGIINKSFDDVVKSAGGE